MKVRIEQYIREDGSNPFEKWFDKLNAFAAVKVTTALYRMEQGNFSNVESVGEGVFLSISLISGPAIEFTLDKKVKS